MAEYRHETTLIMVLPRDLTPLSYSGILTYKPKDDSLALSQYQRWSFPVFHIIPSTTHAGNSCSFKLNEIKNVHVSITIQKETSTKMYTPF